ncbi:MAG TPA: hypothetical protein VGH27_16685 [Streptosporangiaceae bacterium]|jgi:hypothetical protein
MSPEPNQPYVDALDMSTEETHIYEAVAALEYRGRPVRKADIAATASLTEPALDQALDQLTKRGALRRHGSGDDAEYEPANRDWSAVPSDDQLG